MENLGKMIVTTTNGRVSKTFEKQGFVKIAPKTWLKEGTDADLSFLKNKKGLHRVFFGGSLVNDLNIVANKWKAY